MGKGPFHMIVFGRFPKVGKVKTRLIPVLGPTGAASLQKRLTEKTVAVAASMVSKQNGRLVFCHDGGNRKRIGKWLGRSVVECRAQVPGDLGTRMQMAFQQAFDQGAQRVLLVGTDIPGITVRTLENALASLDNNDLVLGPSTDGGYWLVGMKEPVDIFSNMVWSRPDVLEKTLERAGQLRLNPLLLERLTDLDSAEDFDLAADFWKKQTPYLSVVIPTLNEEREIAQTIGFTRSPDAEIIVSDGGSKDHTLDIAGRCGARIVTGNKGRAAQQNRGASVAEGEVLLFLHADTKLPGNFVAHIFDAFMDQATVLGAFQFDTELKTPAMNRIRYWTNIRAKWLKLPYGDQGLFVRKKEFFSAGGFPEVPIAEDLYLARKMARLGRIVIAPAAAVTSARRWEQLGPIRTTFINTLIAVGCLAGVSPQRLAPLYNRPKKRRLS